MSLDPRTLAHRWFQEVWNEGRESVIYELAAPGVIGHGLGEHDNDTHGPDAFKVFWKNLRTAVPDVNVSVEDTLVENDKVMARILLRGTHRGEGLGVPPTGRPVSIGGIVILKVNGGQIAEAWNSWDQLALLQQIGVIPGPQAEDRFLSAKV